MSYKSYTYTKYVLSLFTLMLYLHYVIYVLYLYKNKKKQGSVHYIGMVSAFPHQYSDISLKVKGWMTSSSLSVTADVVGIVSGESEFLSIIWQSERSSRKLSTGLSPIWMWEICSLNAHTILEDKFLFFFIDLCVFLTADKLFDANLFFFCLTSLSKLSVRFSK